MNVDTAMRRLSQSANKGRLWIGLAAVSAGVPGDTRRAAIRGIASLAVTSSIANAALKPLIRRQRPDAQLTPVLRRLASQPRSASFPSGHAASAAAFTTGVALESPALGAAVAPLGAAVAYSRIHVGVHHVSDVLAGAALGAGVALAGLRWWPARQRPPAQVPRRREAPSLPKGQGLLVVVNPRSGNEDDPSAEIQRALPSAELLRAGTELDLDARLSADDGVRALGVAGGDGTVASIAAVALRHSRPLALFPTGTLNHFARDVGVTSVRDAVCAIETGEAVAVDVASVDGVAFLNTASIGGYPEMVYRREKLRVRLGKWPAMAVAAAQVLREHQPISLVLDGVPVRVWLLFVGNGRYASRGVMATWRPRLDDGNLDIQYLRTGRLSRTRAVLAILTGTTERSRVHVFRTARSLRVSSPDGPLAVACDGEPVGSFAEFEFGKLPGRLTVYRPHRSPG